MQSTGHVYVAVSDATKRAPIVEKFRRDGWTVIERPTGFHVLGDIADIIDGRTVERPVKIIVDARAPGCMGTSLEAGLRELGVPIPVELVDPQAVAA
jgi:FixJ family two-component response regulator